MAPKIKRINSLQWIFEPLQEDESFEQRRMFGLDAAYIRGRMVLVVGDSEEPWNGLLVCTSREYHTSLLKDFPELQPHPILPKWLYLSQSNSQFESMSLALVELAKKGDERIGIEPKTKSAVRRRRRDLGKISIKKARNFGPKSQEILAKIGIETLGDLRRLGWERAFKKLVKHDRRWLNLNMVYAMIGAVKEQDWRELGIKDKDRARKLVELLKKNKGQ